MARGRRQSIGELTYFPAAAAQLVIRSASTAASARSRTPSLAAARSTGLRGRVSHLARRVPAGVARRASQGRARRGSRASGTVRRRLIISKWAGHHDSAFTQKTYVLASEEDLHRGQAALARIHKIA